MKLTKTASGKQIVKMSQNEWEDMGKKAGWLDSKGNFIEAKIKKQAEPTVAPPKPKTPTAPPKEKPTQKPTRRKYPNPNVDPVPKGEDEVVKEDEVSPENLPTIASELSKLKKKIVSHSGSIYQKMLLASFQDNAHRSVKGFWNNMPANHPLYQNQFLRENGKTLAEANYQYLTDRQPPVSTSMMELFQLIHNLLIQIKTAESGHQEELGELAKDIVSQEWDIDRDVLDTKFMPEMGGSGSPQEHEVDEVPITPRIQKEINKRVILNTLSQGAGLHALLSMHHLAADRVNEISPQLLRLYDKFANLITQHYFHLDMSVIEQMAAQVAESGTGWVKTEYSEDGPKVKAQAMNFPIMLQELVKGVVGMATDHGLDNESRKGDDITHEEKLTILNHADRLTDEPYLIMVGPEVWRRYLEAQPESSNRFDVLSELSSSDPDNVQFVVSNVVKDPEEAKANLKTIAEELDQYETVTGRQEELAEVDSPDLGEVEIDDDYGFDEEPDHAPPRNSPFGMINSPDAPPVVFDDDDDDDEPNNFSWLLGN